MLALRRAKALVVVALETEQLLEVRLAKRLAVHRRIASQGKLPTALVASETPLVQHHRA